MDAVGLFNLFIIVTRLDLAKSKTGDNFVLDEVNVIINTKDLLLLISLVSLISLTTICGAVKNIFLPATTATLLSELANENWASEPCKLFPDVVLILIVVFVPGINNCCNIKNAVSICLFCVAVTVVPPTSPVDVAAVESGNVIS